MALTERFQVLLSEEQVQALRRHSRSTGKSMGALIREAVDRTYLLAEGEERAHALGRLLSMELPVDDWPQMEQQIVSSYTS